MSIINTVSRFILSLSLLLSLTFSPFLTLSLYFPDIFFSVFFSHDCGLVYTITQSVILNFSLVLSKETKMLVRFFTMRCEQIRIGVVEEITQLSTLRRQKSFDKKEEVYFFIFLNLYINIVRLILRVCCAQNLQLKLKQFWSSEMPTFQVRYYFKPK